MLRWRLATAVLLSIALSAKNPPGLDIQVLEGANTPFAAGQASSRKLSVKVVDSDGAPAAGAAVTFRLPSGRFASGLASEVVLTGSDGKASVYGMQWEEAAGPSNVGVTAVQGDLRSSIEIPVEIQLAAARDAQPSSKKWLWVSLILAGAAAGGLVAIAGGSGQAPAPTTPPIVIPPPTIGGPSITVTKP